MKLIRFLICAVFLLGTTFCASAADLAILRNGFTIRHERREQTGQVVRLYLDAGPDSGYVDVPADQIASFQHDDTPAPATTTCNHSGCNHPEAKAQAVSKADLQRLVSAASDRHQIDEDLITSVIRAESGFNPRARSPKGAQGLMQLMPGTAAKLGVADAYQPEANVDAGTRYLRELLLRYHDDIPKALAAYNAGPERVQQYGGVPPYRETRAYVASVIRDFNHQKLAQKKTSRKKTPARTEAKDRPTTPAASTSPN